MTSRRLPLVGKALVGLLLLAAAPGPARTAEPTAAVIFAYRHFGDDADPSGTIAVEPFEAHLSELKNGGYTVLPVLDIVAALRDNKPLPDRTVGITIDDASASAYTIAWPRLRAAGLPFTLFVSPDTIEAGGGARMSWAQLRELASAGVTIGNQTAGYARLLGQDRAYTIGQVQRAQEVLRAQLGEAPKLFAWPYGEYATAQRDLIAGLGFEAAFGLASGVAYTQSDRFALPRRCRWWSPTCRRPTRCRSTIRRMSASRSIRRWASSTSSRASPPMSAARRSSRSAAAASSCASRRRCRRAVRASTARCPAPTAAGAGSASSSRCPDFESGRAARSKKVHHRGTEARR